MADSTSAKIGTLLFDNPEQAIAAMEADRPGGYTDGRGCWGWSAIDREGARTDNDWAPRAIKFAGNGETCDAHFGPKALDLPRGLVLTFVALNGWLPIRIECVFGWRSRYPVLRGMCAFMTEF